MIIQIYSSACFAGTAIETSMRVTVRLTVLKDKPYVQTPHFSTSPSKDESGGYYCTTGIGPGTSLLLFPGQNLSDICCQRYAKRRVTLSDI